MADLAAVGNRAFVVALAGIGAAPVRADTDEEFRNALRRLGVQRDLRLVFVTEPLAEGAPDAVRAFRERSDAALLALPLMPSDEHPSFEEMRHLVEQATGASLI